VLGFLVTTILCFLVYLLLTTGSGNEVLGLWSWAELIMGLFLSIVTGVIARTVFTKKNYRMANPIRWMYFIVYFVYFFWEMTKANFDVAYRVITGKIHPGIVKIKPDLKTDLGVTLLANSITLTPGTLSVDVDETTNDLYVHWINVKEKALKQSEVDCKYVCAGFPKWIRRIAE